MRRYAAVLAVGLLCVAAVPAAPNGRLGLFTVRLSPLAVTDLPTGKFTATLTDAIRDDLQQADLGQIIPLPWPAALAAGDRPTFETFVGVGREAGCNGVLVLTVASLDFAEKRTSVPLLGSITTRSARLQLTGGLVDVASAAAVANFDLQEKRDSKGDKGVAPAAAMNEGVGGQQFERSPMGAVVQALRPALLKEIVTYLPRLEPATAEPPARRADAPAGLGFELARYQVSIEPGFGRRGTVAVVNRGNAPATFVLRPIQQPEGMLVAALGQGAPSEPCQLGPGQWKYVRIIFNAAKPTAGREVTLGLFTDPNGDPGDQTRIQVDFSAPEPTVEFQVVSQDPDTLAYTCRVLNPTDQAINGLRLAPDPDDGRVDLSPGFASNALHGTVLPAQGSLTFKVIPRFRLGQRKMDVTLRGWLGVAHTNAWPLQFEVPDGKRVYYGTGHTTQYTTNSFESCVNQGDVLIDWGSVNGEMMFKCATERESPDDDVPFNYREWEKRWLDKSWQWVLDTLGVDDYQYPTPDRNADVRGATLRPAVAARLADLDRDATDHPMAAKAKEWLGMAWYMPVEGDRVGVFFRSVARRNRAQRVGHLRLSAKDHDARWPYLRARYETSQAYAVWEDAAPGRQSDVAFRASGLEMNHWRDTAMLTAHGQGVDDPVVQVAGESRVGVIWSDRRDVGRRVYLRLSNDDGKTFAPEVGLPVADGEQQFWPQFAYTPTGLQVIWLSVSGQSHRILSCAADAAGQLQGEPAVLSQPGQLCGEPQVAAGADGKLYAVWREGDGSASEVMFASAPGPSGPWSPARALTADQVYSEYPLVGLEGERVWATWHTDGQGLADLKYYVDSTDGGATWSSPQALPSLENTTAKAWLEVSFQMQWPRSSYVPFDTIVEVNGQEIGRLKQVIPDGTYLFEVPPELVPCLASRRPQAAVRLISEGCSGAHYLLATNTRLIIQRRFSQIPVVAASQAEADALASRVGADFNHSQPDLALMANQVQELPDTLAKGTRLELPLQLQNLGEAAASEVKVAAYSADPRDPLAQALMLGEATVRSVGVGKLATVQLHLTGRASQTARLFVAVTSKESDHYPDDNLWTQHFVVGAEQALPPLLGTDVPNVIYAPSLLPNVQLPNVRALQTVLANPDLGAMLGHGGWPLPSAPSVNGYLQQAMSALNLPNVPGLPGLPGLPGFP